MATVLDVGDAIELTFLGTTGASVTVSWYDPTGTAVFEGEAVTENPPGSGRFPKTVLPDAEGDWRALFQSTGAATEVEEFWVKAIPVGGPPPLATVAEVAIQYGSLTAAQEGLTKWLLRAASKMIRARYPGIDARIAAGTVDGDVVALVAAAMVLRVLRNPAGLRAKTVGPFSYTYDTTVAAGLLAISADEAGMLVPVTVGARGVGTIRVTAGMMPPVRHRRWGSDSGW